MRTAEQADEAVLAFLREHSPCSIRIRDIAAAAGLPVITVRTSVWILAHRRAICIHQWTDNYGTDLVNSGTSTPLTYMAFLANVKS